MSWADRAAPIVADVIRRVGRTDQQALTEAYPWGGSKEHSLQSLAGWGAPSVGPPAECAESRSAEHSNWHVQPV